jgi:hypothetical protein
VGLTFRAARRNSSGAAKLAEARFGLSAAGLSAPFGGASRAEAEHELYLFLCLRVWAYCIDRCYLVDPSFVRDLAVGKGPYPDSGFGFSRFARTDFFDPRRDSSALT